MKKLIFTAAIVVAGAGAAMADPAAGTWKTEPGDTGGYLHVKVAPCGSNICGTITKAFDETGAEVANYEHAGKRMLWDMNADGGGKYSGGQVWAADSDKTYKSKMSLSGSTLTVKGCVAVICRGQDWKRVN
ncbi:MAG: DUF2147 domain-containing protein [Shimia sp.]|uniref:DUF2147 domain-containing protein n=1 Tax=Shimia sp. TaxID=1954381 RepID=UPI004058F978